MFGWGSFLGVVATTLIIGLRNASTIDSYFLTARFPSQLTRNWPPYFYNQALNKTCTSVCLMPENFLKIANECTSVDQ